ncbi:hypothetical protein BU25DRAFT_411450 [Macroventuria anomochaeta]|uniref:Uncharacterized protein n=1 Tax=Macroventuria anomochaeta TaxID=301207 RepID=A0ACB6RY65_9PLEO|nr:uncharacterized protein BU25DRAFT_411450 [Macroventuria anomochaeta]KAF2626925.1 hypothetical protein BU25DRAFT_411450 [Macroventuria anomochaeta]
MLEVLTKRLADLEGCSACHDHKKERAVGHEDLCPALVKLEEDVIHLRRAVNFSNRVLDGCWKRECSILNTLLDIQRRKQTQRSVLARLLARKNHDHVNNYVDLRDGESKTSNIVTGIDIPLSRKELDALIHIAAQNVQILREDVGDVVELLNKCKV